jgi:hypothetical protein
MDLDPFLTPLYVMSDDFCQSAGFAQKQRPGPAASLSWSEVVTLAVFGQWARFPSERAFYRYAVEHLRSAFPTLPEREPFNRLQRSYRAVIVAFALYLVEQMQARCCLDEALDSSAIPTRDAKRRGSGWLAGQADLGWSKRMGWDEGFHLLTSITPSGVIPGFGFAPASCNDHALAETFFAARAQPSPHLPRVGAPAQGVSVADKGFAGEDLHRRWHAQYGAEVVSPPHQRRKVRWSKDWRRWLAGLRQIIESIYDKLLNTLRLARQRPHALDGFQARLAAKVALQNFCLWLNLRLGREPLAFAELLVW